MDTAFAGGAQLSDLGLDLLQRMLQLNPERRITAQEALIHPWWAAMVGRVPAAYRCQATARISTLGREMREKKKK